MGKKDGTSKRDDLQKYLEEMELVPDYITQYLYMFNRVLVILDIRRGFPRCRKSAENCLSLPMYPELKDEQIEYIADKIKEFLD